MLSYWEKKHFLKTDLLIVGAGFVGLSTALHYKKIHPEKEVLVIERGVFPTGASTRNAGFACFGSLTEILDDLKYMSEQDMLRLVQRRYEGLCRIREEFGDVNVDYIPSGGFELLDSSNIDALDSLDRVNDQLRSLFPDSVFTLSKSHKSFRFSDRIISVVKNQYEGELDPGKYMKSLWSKAVESGVKILTGLSVDRIDAHEAMAFAKDSSGRDLDFKAKKLAVCTNAFSQSLIPQLDVKPGRGLILLSEKLDFNAPWEGSFHMDKGYVYFRKIDDRLLIGGGRNVDFEGEESPEFEVNPLIKSYLEKLTEEVIFPGNKLNWEMTWTGIMGFGKTKKPIIESVTDRTSIAVRLGGMGVAIGWQVGKELSDLLSEA